MYMGERAGLTPEKIIGEAGFNRQLTPLENGCKRTIIAFLKKEDFAIVHSVNISKIIQEDAHLETTQEWMEINKELRDQKILGFRKSDPQLSRPDTFYVDPNVIINSEAPYIDSEVLTLLSEKVPELPQNLQSLQVEVTAIEGAAISIAGVERAIRS